MILDVRNPKAIVVIALVAVLTSTEVSRADTCDAEPLRARLVHERDRSQMWRWGWAIGFGVASTAQGIAAAIVDDRTQREILATSAVKAGLGFGARLILPVRIDIPNSTGDACADLVALRTAVEKVGRRERLNFWLNHVGGLAVNLAGAAWLTHRTTFKSGAISFAIGFPVGLASTYTMPRGMWHLWRDGDATLTGYSTSF